MTLEELAPQIHETLAALFPDQWETKEWSDLPLSIQESRFQMARVMQNVFDKILSFYEARPCQVHQRLAESEAERIRILHSLHPTSPVCGSNTTTASPSNGDLP